MASTRTIAGISVSGGLEGADVALLSVDGLGLAMTPSLVRSQRMPFSRELREGLHLKLASPRAMGEALASALRRVVENRELFCIGLLAPNGGAFSTAAEALADRSGITVLTSFASRDLAAGGSGGPLTPAADFLLAHSPREDRLLVHLGSVTTIVNLPAAGRWNDTLAFDAGPGSRFLDALVQRCTREMFDNGSRAVQGKSHDGLVSQWMHEPFLLRKPPKVIGKSDFDEAFASRVLDDCKREGLGLNDVLCTASHFVARCVGQSTRQWVKHTRPRTVALSGGGTRNGFLRQLLASQFAPDVPVLTETFGLPTLARKANAAAVLAALTLDGVTGNLPHLTGATGGRLMGRIVPGDPRNWGTVAAWAAEQMWDYTHTAKAA